MTKGPGGIRGHLEKQICLWRDFSDTCSSGPQLTGITKRSFLNVSIVCAANRSWCAMGTEEIFVERMRKFSVRGDRWDS